MSQLAIFYHIGGVVMDDEEKRHRWENDPPGWYLWRHENGVRRLCGPYDSRESAQSQVDSSAWTHRRYFQNLIRKLHFFDRFGLS